jgi:hypothetical protein
LKDTHNLPRSGEMTLARCFNAGKMVRARCVVAAATIEWQPLGSPVADATPFDIEAHAPGVETPG